MMMMEPVRVQGVGHAHNIRLYMESSCTHFLSWTQSRNTMSSISKQLSSITCTVRRPPPPPCLPEIRMVMLGKTGCGKSSTANTILGRKVFDARVSSSSVTVRCRRAHGEYRGRHLMLLDTPGLMDTHQAPQEVMRELRRSVSLLYPGPHVFLVLINIGRFGQEEREAVRRIKQAMGSQALRFSVVIFTHGDLLEEGSSVRQCLMDKCRDLERLVEECGGRYCVFNNHSSRTKEQVAELFGLVDSMVQGNEGSYYSINSLQKAEEDLERELQQEQRVLDEREAAFRKKQEVAMKEWCNKEVKAIQEKNMREVAELKKQQELERHNQENAAREREEAFRRETEESQKREKERKVQEMMRVMEIRGEEEQRREALREKLDQATKMLGEQAEQEQRARRAMEERIQRERMDQLVREREREVQHIQREQAFRQREEAKREELQKELDKLVQSLEEQGRREEEGKQRLEAELRQERQEHQREREAQAEREGAARRRSEALKQELREITAKIEEQAAHEQVLKRRLEENLRRERERRELEMSMLRRRCGEAARAAKAAKAGGGRSAVTTVGGYAQEMGLLGLNAALETVGASCSIQ